MQQQALSSIYVCQAADVPAGEMRCFEVSNSRILIAHTTVGFLASDEMCTHEDASLCDGNLSGSLVKCPLHGSRFDLQSGEVLDDPADENLCIYPVVVEDDKIYINMRTGQSEA